MTKPNRATPGGRNRRILANGRSSGRSTTRWPGWNVRRTARIVPVSAAGPASARGGARRAQGRRRWGRAPDPAGVADGRLPGCQQADSRGTGCVTVPSGLAGQPGGSWSFPAGNHNEVVDHCLAAAAGAGHRAPEEGSRWCGPGWAWCGIPLAKVLQNPDRGPQRADSHHLQPAGPSRPPRLAAASPGWRHRPWRACRASGQRNGRGLRRWPRPSGMRAAPSMPRDAPGGPADPVLTRLRCGACRAGWPPRGPAAAGSPAASDAIGGMRHRQQCAPSRHRARTRRSETRRPDGVCSRSVIGAPPDRSAHSRRYGRRPVLQGDCLVSHITGWSVLRPG